MAKRALGDRKTITTNTRWTSLEYKRLVSRRISSGAKTDSAYIRGSALTGPEFQMPSFETLRDWRNEVMRLAGVLESCPSSKLRDETLAEAKAALGRMCK
jgi:hypothetical protein